MPATTPTTFCGIQYLTRAAWGADESKRFKNGAENTPTAFYPLQSLTGHHSAGKLVTAFHNAGYNSGNLGIALLGTLTGQQATAAARHSLTALLAGLSLWHDLDPEADITYVNPINGVTKAVETISGHRDWLATDCPGTLMYDALPALRSEVARLVGGAR
ncbi:peptidoglycan recognition protein family protein [Kitasatospora sp. P5_F3]